MNACRSWAESEFGHASLKDARLTHRLVRMATCAAEKPSGVVAQVFKDPAERQAAYDLLSNSRVPSEQMVESIAEATVERCSADDMVFVVLDGSSISLSDSAKSKQLGSIGAHKFPTRGLKFVTAYAVDSRGVPLGLLHIQAWRRGAKKRAASRFIRRRKGLTEMAQQWCPAVQAAIAHLKDGRPNACAWLVGDRECDDARFLRLASSVGTFTVRAAQNRLVEPHRGRKRKLFSIARAGRSYGKRVVQIPATPKRRARIATLEIRVATTKVLLPLHDGTQARDILAVSVIYVREVGQVRGARLQWILLTNAPVDTQEQVDKVIASYRAR